MRAHVVLVGVFLFATLFRLAQQWRGKKEEEVEMFFVVVTPHSHQRKQCNKALNHVQTAHHEMV
jgi:hypothetical protein